MKWYLSTIITGLLLSANLVAAPLPKNNTPSGGPVLVGQATSIEALIATTRAIVTESVTAELLKKADTAFLKLLDPKKVKGVDTKKPFGLYAFVDGSILQMDFTKSGLVLLIPVVSEKEFNAALTSIDIKIGKADADGIATLTVPEPLPFTIAMRFHKGYAYIAIPSEKALDAKLLYDPPEVISDKEDALLSLRLRIDRIPLELKTTAIQYVELLPTLAKNFIAEESLRDAAVAGSQLALRWSRALLDDGKELSYRVVRVPSSLLGVEEVITLEAKSGTPLAKMIAERTATKNAFAGLIGADSAAHFLGSFPLFNQELRTIGEKLCEYGLQESEKNPPLVLAEFQKELARIGMRTMKSGNLDLAASFNGPDAKKHYTVVGAISCRDSAPLLKALKSGIDGLPEADRNLWKWDAAKIEGLPVVEYDPADNADEETINVFGKSKVLVIFAKDAIYAAYGPDAAKYLKEALTAKSKEAPALDATLRASRLKPLVEMIPEKEMKEIFQGYRKDPVALSFVKVDGGEKLVLRFNGFLANMVIGGGTSLMGGLAAQEFKNAPQVKPKE